MRRGQEAARGIFNDLNIGGYMNYNRQNCSGGPGYGGPGYGYTPWNPMAMVTEQWIAMMCAWTQAWCSMTPGFRQYTMNPCAPTNPCPPTEERAEPIRLVVSASGPVEYSATLCPGLNLNCIEVEPISGPAGQDLQSRFFRDQAGIVLKVEVPKDQPPGKYFGRIFRKPDRFKVGEVIVEVKPPAVTPPPVTQQTGYQTTEGQTQTQSTESSKRNRT
jgi:hypothetical protein